MVNKFRSHAYLDVNLDRYSNVGVGLMCRAIGHGLSVSYVNSRTNQLKLIGFFRNFENVDFYFNDYLPEKFSSDLIIFDNCDFTFFGRDDILEMIEKKKCEIVFVFSNKDEFDLVKDEFDLVSEYFYTGLENSDFGSEKINITGDGKGKSTWCCGVAIRNLIAKRRVKLIYFDKGGDIYGERKFFENLGDSNLDLEVFGTQRFDGKSFRFDNLKEDFEQARSGLDSLKKTQGYDIVIGDELNTISYNKLAEVEDVLDALSVLSCDIVVSGRYADSKLKLVFNQNIEVKEVKHYLSKGSFAKMGIDY